MDAPVRTASSEPALQSPIPGVEQGPVPGTAQLASKPALLGTHSWRLVSGLGRTWAFLGVLTPQGHGWSAVPKLAA